MAKRNYTTYSLLQYLPKRRQEQLRAKAERDRAEAVRVHTTFIKHFCKRNEDHTLCLDSSPILREANIATMRNILRSRRIPLISY